MSIFKRTPVDWELIDKTILPSAYEQGGQTLRSGSAEHLDALYAKTVVFTFKDRLSGRIKQNSVTSGTTGDWEP